METLKSIGNGVVSAVRSYPKGALILWGVSLVVVIIGMWG